MARAVRRDRPPRLLTPANVLTLSRAGAAALMAAAAAKRQVSAGAWTAALAGATAADWIDGALARRTRTDSTLGALLDIEADSWLTLWCAIAAFRAGHLPGWCLLAPVLRYLTAGADRHAPAAWQRAAGAAQMGVLIGALSPFGGLRAAARRGAPLAVAAQLAALAADVTRAAD